MRERPFTLSGVARVAAPTAPLGCRFWVIQPKLGGRNVLSHLKSSAIFTVAGTASAARSICAVSGRWASIAEVSMSPAARRSGGEAAGWPCCWLRAALGGLWPRPLFPRQTETV